MVFLEGQARPLLLLHALLGAATVAVATHLALWVRRALRGQARLAGLRWFGGVALALFAAQFAAGNLLYPTYKVRVRGEYLDQPSAVAADARLRRDARTELHARAGLAAPADPDEDADGEGPPRHLARIARLFDVKEHVAALALPLASAVCALALAWRPDRDGPAPGRLLYGCALALAASAWFAAVVGILVTSYRAVG